MQLNCKNLKLYNFEIMVNIKKLYKKKQIETKYSKKLKLKIVEKYWVK